MPFILTIPLATSFSRNFQIAFWKHLIANPLTMILFDVVYTKQHTEFIQWSCRFRKTYKPKPIDLSCFLQIFCRSWGILSLIIAYCWQLYTLWILVQLHEAVPGKRYNRYVELAQAAFGKNFYQQLLLFRCYYIVMTSYLNNKKLVYITQKLTF